MTSQELHHDPPSWRALLDDQQGVISRRQALRGGLAEDQWQWRLDAERWRRVVPGVAVAHTGHLTDRQRGWVAVLHAGPGAHLTGDAALVEFGMTLPLPTVLHVVVPPGRRSGAVRMMLLPEEARTQVRPHRLAELEAWRHPVRRPAVLRLAPAVLHAVAWAATDRAAEWRIAAVVQQRLTRVRDLREVLAQMPRLPRRGLVRVVLDDVEFGAQAASELAFLRFLRRHGLPLPDRLQRPLRVGAVRYLDVWWERQRVAVEIDGAHHRTVGTWESDGLRANDVVLAERHDRVLLLRLTAGNLRHDADRVVAQLTAALR